VVSLLKVHSKLHSPVWSREAQINWEEICKKRCFKENLKRDQHNCEGSWHVQCRVGVSWRCMEPSECTLDTASQGDTASTLATAYPGSTPYYPNIGLPWNYSHEYLSNNRLPCKQQRHAYWQYRECTQAECPTSFDSSTSVSTVWFNPSRHLVAFCVFLLCNTESIITAAPCRNSILGCIHFWKRVSLSRLQVTNSQGWEQDSVATTQWHSLGTQRTCCVSERMLWSSWTVCWQEKRVLSPLENMCRPSFRQLQCHSTHTHPSHRDAQTAPSTQGFEGFLIQFEYSITAHWSFYGSTVYSVSGPLT